MTSCLSQHKYKIGFWGVIVPGAQIIASYANPNAHAFYLDSSIGNIPGVVDIPNIVPATVVPALFALVMYGIYKAIKSPTPAQWTQDFNQPATLGPSSPHYSDSTPTPQTMNDDIDLEKEKSKEKKNDGRNRHTSTTTSSSECCSSEPHNDWDLVDYLFCWIVLDNIGNRNSGPSPSSSNDPNCCDGSTLPDADNCCTGCDGCSCDDCCMGCDLNCSDC